MREVFVFGHKKPDTDSVTSAIALSYLKNQLGMKTKPMILGPVNKETQYVLDYFGFQVPEFLEDVKLQVKDLYYYKDCYLDCDSSINTIYDYISKKNITGVPIVDKNKKLMGLLTSKMIGAELINGDYDKLCTSYDNILEVLNGKEVLKFDDEISGNIIAAAYKSTTFLENLNLNNNTIMIVGDRHSLIESAVNKKVKLIIIVSNLNIKEEHLEIARQNKVNIIKTPHDTFHTAKLIGLSNYGRNLLEKYRNVSFREDDYYDDFKEKSIKTGFNNFPVVDNNGICLGLVRITDINRKNRKQVILVDHNESSQSVEGLDEAEILEIVDHHKIGDLTTNMPINFRNMTVGSTNSVIYSMYKESSVEIPSNIAGLMLSGIISDTLKFTSPTTTEYDRFIANMLAIKANINIDEFSSSMFKAGTNLEGKTIDDIVLDDIKTYNINNKRIAISQLITLNSEEILEKKEEYVNRLNKIRNNKEYDVLLLCVTDIIKDGSYIFFPSINTEFIRETFGDNEINEGHFLKKCFSRKKQIVPLIMGAIK